MGMASFFDDGAIVDFESTGQNQDTLEKALTAGYGTDAAAFTGGRALQPEDLETTLVNVLDTLKEDCKLFNGLHKQPMKSTVHQYTRRVGVGDDDFNFVGEGEEVSESEQETERKFVNSKYIGTMGKVTKPREIVDGIEDAYNSEKIAATTRIARSTERSIFHGDSSVVPKQFDGIIKLIKDSANDTKRSEKNRATLIDLRGYQIGEDVAADDKGILTGEDLFDDVAQRVFSKGGGLDKALYPAVLAGQFRTLYNDRLRYLTGDRHTGLGELPDIVTAIGSTIRIKGENAGADKMFKVKGKVVAAGNVSKRPNAPASVTAVAVEPSRGESKFISSHAGGDYLYAVHAVNSKGISAGTNAAAAVAVAEGKAVKLTITPDPNGETPTGYIITRSNKEGTVLMEMISIPALKGESTEYEDLNVDLPGTASIVLLSEKTQELKPNLSFAQLMALSTFPLPMDAGLNLPFVAALFGTVELRAPEFCALIDNIGYQGGLY